MIKYILRIVLLLCAGCMSVSCVRTGSTAWQARVDAVLALRKEYRFPQYLAAKDAVKQGTEFDVNQYFKVLTHLQMKPGYVLDYVYHYDGMGGLPKLYARPSDQSPFKTEVDLNDALLKAAIQGKNASYYTYLEVEDSAEGYFEYVVFNIMAAQFYLYWHAGYNDTQIVCDTHALEALLNQTRIGVAVPKSTSLQARLLELEPEITLHTETAVVKIITFSNWKGFVEETWTINRHSPHSTNTESKVLIPYNCGIMF